MGQQSAEPPEHAPQYTGLQQHEQQHQPEAAENRMDDALLTLFQEPEAPSSNCCILSFMFC